MSEHYVPKLGEIIAPDDHNAARDCVHFAVAPLRAAELLLPGQDFDVDGGVAVAAEKGKGVGIVDPFLANPVGVGHLFWGVIYQNTITGMRHQWTHPAFAPKIPGRKKE